MDIELELRQNKNNHGFSLTEATIVVVIVAILAGVAIPIYKHNLHKEQLSEADVSLRSIRLQVALYKASYGHYPTQEVGEKVVGATWNSFESGELTGKYFTDSSFRYFGDPDGVSYQIKCARGDVLTHDRILDQDGVLGNG